MATPLYHEAADVLHAVLNGRGLKDATYGSKLRHTKAVYAIVAETLRHRRLLDSIALSGGLTKAAKAADVQDLSAVIVMAYELLMGEGKIKGGGKLKRVVVESLASMKKSKAVLEKSIAATVKKASKASKSAGTAAAVSEVSFDPASVPRYIRVNRVLQQHLHAAWSELGESLLQTSVVGVEAPDLSLAQVVDEHIPGVLALPPSSAETAARHPAVQEGKIILQDRSSCFSAQALLSVYAGASLPGAAATASSEDSAEVASAAFANNKLPAILQAEVSMCLPTGEVQSAFDVIDACAAPGNKTAHLAALLEASGLAPANARVLAFDRSGKRLDVLKRRMQQMGTEKWVVPTQVDFLTVDPADSQYARVRAILLDPSCSGSGMVTRVDHGAQGGAGGGIHLPDVAPEDSIFEAAAANARPKSRGVGRPGGRMGSHSNKRGAKRSREASTGQGGAAQDVSALAAFQFAALCHALSFPQVRRVAYSTCSIHTQENEAVVLGALARINATGPKWRTVQALPSWPRRGVVPTAADMPADATEGRVLLGGGEGDVPAAKRAAGDDGSSKAPASAAVQGVSAAVGFDASHLVCVNPFLGDRSGGFFQAVLERVD
jgi:putative methyltransferase